MKRNLLCIKQKDRLENGERLLYEPYKNIIINLVELATKVEAKDFDPVAKVYDGLISVPTDIKEYHEALLGVTGYYQHSQGGRGKYIEKKIASAFESCSLDIKLSELPTWLETPVLHKKKGIFTLQGLTAKEKTELRKTSWDWLGGASNDESSDIGSIIKEEKTIVLTELKNRIDTGGTAARREIWTSRKFGIFIDHLIDNTILYRKEKETYSLPDILKHFEINSIELYIGILFDKGDRPATIANDKSAGFYSSSKEGFKLLVERLKKSSKKVSVSSLDAENLIVEGRLKNPELKFCVGALYGNEITAKLFRKEFPVTDLLLLKYDDMWLSQLCCIEERTILLKCSKNCTTITREIMLKDSKARDFYNNLIENEGDEKSLNMLLDHLFKTHESLFVNDLVPEGEILKVHLADVIQILAAAES